MRARHFDQVWHARHRAVVVHDLADRSGGLTARQTGQVDRSLGVTATLEHATVARAQREHVARRAELVGACIRIESPADRARAVVRADARVARRAHVDGNGERRFGAGFVLRHHRAQLQRVKPLGRHRHAEQPSPVRDHEVHGFGGDLVGRHDEVAFVLAVGRVDDDHDLAARDGLDGLLDRGEHLRYGLQRRFRDCHALLLVLFAIANVWLQS